MSNPLRLFRKYQYVFLVAFGIMLMFAFVVGPIVSDYLDSRMGGGMGANPVVASWKGGELREVEMANARTIHLLVTRFLQQLVSRVMVVQDDVIVERQGQRIKLLKHRTYPLVSRGYDESGQMAFQIMVEGERVMVAQTKKGAPEPQVVPIRSRAQLIAQASGEEELVQRMLLAEEAGKQGVVIGEDTVVDYLDNLCDVTPETRPDYAAMLSGSTNGRLDMRRFVRHMSMELAAQRMLIMSQGGLFGTPPEVLYQCYNKLNRRITAELLAVDVSDFVNEVGEPTEADILSLYDDGKTRFPIPTSPKPGFKQRKKIAFQYVVGRYDDFERREIERIRPTVTDAEIERYYAENKETQYKAIELPDAEPGADIEQDAAEEAAENVEAEMTSEPEAVPSEVESEPAKTDPAPAKAAPVKPSESQPDEEDAAEDQVSAERSSIKFASYQEPPSQPEAEPAAQDEGAAPPAAGDTLPQTPEPAASKAAPAPESDDNSAEADTNSVETPGTDQTEPKVEAPEGQAKQPPEKPASYKPLDEQLRGEIRETLARQKAREPAQEALEEAISKVNSAVNKYGRKLSLSADVEGAEAPAPLDIEAIATENNLTAGSTPEWDVLDITLIRQGDPGDSDPPAYELARATETLWSQSGQARRSLAEVAFAGELDRYVPRRFVDGIVMPGAFPIPPQKLFLYWRVKEVPEKTPPLEEIRNQVIEAWKTKQALQPALAKAEQLAEQVRKAGKPMAEVFSESSSKVIQTMQFSWMTRGSMPGGMGGRPMLSPVNGLVNNRPVNVSGAGNDFMRSVFDLKVGEVGTAIDEPQSFVYVVRVDGEDLSDDQRREAFYAYMASPTADVAGVVQEEQAEIIRGWYDGLEMDYDVTWARAEPDNDWTTQM